MTLKAAGALNFPSNYVIDVDEVGASRRHLKFIININDLSGILHRNKRAQSGHAWARSSAMAGNRIFR